MIFSILTFGDVDCWLHFVINIQIIKTFFDSERRTAVPREMLVASQDVHY